MAHVPGEDWGIGILEEGREEILVWREIRLKRQAKQKSFLGLNVYSFNLKTLHTFVHNFNYMVIFHMAIAAIAVFLAKHFDLSFDIQLSLLISPIVFPLAFSINADFQRRDTVLEHIAHFESSGMILYMCLREWRKDTGFEYEWINQFHDKLKSILFLLREYLFTDEDNNRKFILRAIYEDFSDTNQMIEQMRTSKLQSNGPLMSRAIHLLSLMCLAFERLRVVKEYRSPRSIRAFNKVLIMLLPLIMAPYFVFLGKKSVNEWSPYFISVVVAFVFSALQGVQDKLDDPFDGMGEDDIKLNAIDEWALDSFETTCQRYNVGRFNVSVEKNDFSEKIFPRRKTSTFTSSLNSINCIAGDMRFARSKKLSTHSVASSLSSSIDLSKRENLHDPVHHPYRDVLENMKPNTCIKNKPTFRKRFSENEEKQSVESGCQTMKNVYYPLSVDNKSIYDKQAVNNFLDTGISIQADVKCQNSVYSAISNDPNIITVVENINQIESSPLQNSCCENNTVSMKYREVESHFVKDKNGKATKKMKRYFRTSPIHEESEISEGVNNNSTINSPSNMMKNIAVVEKDKTLVDKAELSYNPSQNSPNIVSMDTNFNCHNQNNERHCTEIDILPIYGIDKTSNPSTKEKFKMKQCDNDFGQPKDLHSRLS